MRRMFSEKQIKEMISAGAQNEIADALDNDLPIFENITDSDGYHRFLAEDYSK